MLHLQQLVQMNSEAMSLSFQIPSNLIINEEVNLIAVKAKDSLEKKRRSSLGSK